MRASRAIAGRARTTRRPAKTAIQRSAVASQRFVAGVSDGVAANLPGEAVGPKLLPSSRCVRIAPKLSG